MRNVIPVSFPPLYTGRGRHHDFGKNSLLQNVQMFGYLEDINMSIFGVSNANMFKPSNGQFPQNKLNNTFDIMKYVISNPSLPTLADVNRFPYLVTVLPSDKSYPIIPGVISDIDKDTNLDDPFNVRFKYVISPESPVLLRENQRFAFDQEINEASAFVLVNRIFSLITLVSGKKGNVSIDSLPLGNFVSDTNPCDKKTLKRKLGKLGLISRNKIETDDKDVKSECENNLKSMVNNSVSHPEKEEVLINNKVSNNEKPFPSPVNLKYRTASEFAENKNRIQTNQNHDSCSQKQKVTTEKIQNSCQQSNENMESDVNKSSELPQENKEVENKKEEIIQRQTISYPYNSHKPLFKFRKIRKYEVIAIFKKLAEDANSNSEPFLSKLRTVEISEGKSLEFMKTYVEIPITKKTLSRISHNYIDGDYESEIFERYYYTKKDLMKGGCFIHNFRKLPHKKTEYISELKIYLDDIRFYIDRVKTSTDRRYYTVLLKPKLSPIMRANTLFKKEGNEVYGEHMKMYLSLINRISYIINKLTDNSGMNEKTQHIYVPTMFRQFLEFGLN